MKFRRVEVSGSHWKDGRFFRFSTKFQKILVIRPWNPYPAAWEIDVSSKAPKWRGVFPDLRVASWHISYAPAPGNHWDRPLRAVEGARSVDEPPPFIWKGDLRRISAITSFLNEIPREARWAVRECRQQWAMLRLIKAGGKPYLDLCSGSLAIAYGLACLRVFHPVKKPLRSARALLRPGVRRRDIAEYMGFQRPNTAVQLLSKIPVSELSLGTILEVRRALTQGEPLAQQLPRVTRAALALLRPEFHGHVTPQLVNEVAVADEGYPETAGMLRDVLMLAEAARGRESMRGLRFRSRRALWNVHGELAGLNRRLVDPSAKDINIPPPPLSGGRFGGVDFTPLETVDAICRQGVEQRNCLSTSYARRIEASHSDPHGASLYLYKLKALDGPGSRAPEEATLLVSKDRFGRLRIEEMHGFANRSTTLWDAARAFLRQETQAPEATSEDQPELPDLLAEGAYDLR